MKKIIGLVLGALILKSGMQAQTCNAVPVITLSPAGVGGIATHMMVAYNPVNDVYYWNTGGYVSNAIASYSSTGGGTLAVAMGNQDWRGLWWNSNTNTLEGNCFSSAGIFTVPLLPNGNPAGGSAIVCANQQPNAQSGGQYDPVNNQVLYYDGAGAIAKYSRSTGSLVSTVPITGLPVGLGNIAAYGFYTGLAGMEYAVFDYTNKRAYYINYTTGAFVSTVQFPVSAGSPGNYMLSYANGLFFIFDNTNWVGFRAGIFALAVPANICSGSSTTLIAMAGSNYTWSPSGVNTSSMVVNPGVTTSYTVASTPTAGCLSSITLTVNVTPIPSVSVNSGSVCSGNSFTMFPSGANSYTIQGGNAVVTPTANASYTVIGSTNGCLSNSFATSGITVNISPTISVNSGSICSGNAFTILPTGANSYTIEGGSAVVNPTTNTSYTVTGTSSAGCSSQAFATSSVSVNVAPLPTISVNSGTVCSGNVFTIIPSGANSYTFQGGSAVVSPTANSTYTVTGTNSAGCVSQSFATSSISITALPSLSISGAGTICAGVESATLTVSGADSYSWNTGPATSSIVVSPLTSTSYTAKGTSSLTGCTGSASINLIVSPCTGINQFFSANSDLRVYPNPSKGEFTIELNGNVITSIQLTDPAGRIVYSSDSVKDKVYLSLSNLANGMYFLKVQNNTRTEVLKLIKEQ